MSKETREAAERVLSRLSACCKTKGNCGDITDVCNEVIANNLPDDDVLVDEEWYRKVSPYLCEHCDLWRSAGIWVLRCCGRLICVDPTRGDVRRLCKVLKLELVERVEERQSV